MCAPSSHPSTSAFSCASTVPGCPRLERGSRVRGWDSSLGFDHSSPERGKKNHSEFYLLLGKRHWDGREKANPVRN